MNYDPSNKVAAVLTSIHQSLAKPLTDSLVKGYHGEVTLILRIQDGHPNRMQVTGTCKYQFAASGAIAPHEVAVKK